MVDIFNDNGVTMTLGQYLDIRDDLKDIRAFVEELETFARDNRCSYNPSKRDVYDIGRKVLAMFDLAETIEEETDAKAD